MKKKAFSLVELLVVIGIIGILTAIWIPAIVVVRDAAVRARAMREAQEASEYGGDPLYEAGLRSGRKQMVDHLESQYGELPIQLNEPDDLMPLYRLSCQVDLMTIGESGYMDAFAIRVTDDRAVWVRKKADVTQNKQRHLRNVKIFRFEDGYTVCLSGLPDDFNFEVEDLKEFRIKKDRYTKVSHVTNAGNPKPTKLTE